MSKTTTTNLETDHYQQILQLVLLVRLCNFYQTINN